MATRGGRTVAIEPEEGVVLKGTTKIIHEFQEILPSHVLESFDIRFDRMIGEDI